MVDLMKFNRYNEREFQKIGVPHKLLRFIGEKYWKSSCMFSH